MTWKSVHHRGETLRAVIATANVRRDGLLPMDVAGVAETFDGELSLLAALQLKWHTRLAGRLDRELGEQPLDLEQAVVRAWCDLADELPGVRAVLDHYRSAPLDDAMARAMAKATAKEHLLLATMAGRCSVGDASAAPVGARIEQAARRAQQQVVSFKHVGEPHPSLLQRLKALVAA